MHSTVIVSGRYKGYILESVPDSVLEALWRELDSDHAGSGEEEISYSEEERTLLDMIVCETVDRWNRTHEDKISP